MIRWGGKPYTIIPKMLRDSNEWEDTPINEVGEDSNPPTNPDSNIDDVPVGDRLDNPPPEDYDDTPVTPSDPPGQDVEPEPDPPAPPLPSGVFPTDNNTWVRGTIIERDSTKLIRLDTSYTTSATEFFGQDAVTITTETITITQDDERFTSQESTKIIAQGEKIAFLDSGMEDAFNAWQQLPEDLGPDGQSQLMMIRDNIISTTTSRYGVEVGDTIRWGASEYVVESFSGNSFIVNGNFDGLVKSEFEIDSIIEVETVDPTVAEYTDNQVDYYEITSTGDSVINLQENTLQSTSTNEFYDIVPGDRVDVKFTPPSEASTPNWLGAFFVNISDIREVAIGDDYFAALGLTTFTFSNGLEIQPSQTPLPNWWIQTELNVGGLTPGDIQAYNEWVASDFKISPVPQVAIKPFVFQVGSYAEPLLEDFEPPTQIPQGILYGMDEVGNVISGEGIVQLDDNGGPTDSLTYGTIANANSIPVEQVVQLHQAYIQAKQEYLNTIDAFEEEVITWTEIYGPDILPLYDSDEFILDSDGNPTEEENPNYNKIIEGSYLEEHPLYEWFTTAVSQEQISQDQLNDYQAWLTSGRTVSPFSRAQFPPLPFTGELPPPNLNGCVDDRAMNWIPWAAIDDGSCLYYPHIVDSILWQWGDGTWSQQLLEPGVITPYDHTYENAGLYTVNMYLKYVDGDVDTFQTQVAVRDEPRALKNLWDWGDGDFEETDGQDYPPPHIYRHPGVYQVALTTLFTDGLETYTETTSQEVTISPNDTPKITIYAHGKEENIADKENEMTFVIGAQDLDGQIVNYEFDFGDGSDIIQKDVVLEDKKYWDDELFTERKRYRNPGTYVAKASVRDNSGNISTTHKIIWIDDVKYVPTYEPFVAQITEVLSPTLIRVDRSWAEEAIARNHVWGNPGSPAPNEAEDGEWIQGKEWEYPFKRADVHYRAKDKRDLRTLINLGKDRFGLVTNFRSDNLTFHNWPNSVIFKLYDPLPDSIQEKDFVHVSREMLPSVQKKVNLIDFVDEKIDGIVLRAPNYWSQDLPFEKSATDFKNREQIVSSNSDVASQLEDAFVSQSDLSVELNIDYTEYENFIKFSSVQRRYDNFEYKVRRIEHYNALSHSLLTISSSTSDIRSAERNIRQIKNGFDSFEKYMYFQSSSYTTSSLGEFHDTSWPKESGTGTLLDPYVLAHSTSSQYLVWKSGNEESASLYDRKNLDRLVNNLPLHVKDDDRNEQFFKFVDMTGHYFDDIWLYTKGLTDINHRTNKVNEGLSRDLVHEVAKGFGWKVYDGKSLISLPQHHLGVEVSGSGNVAIQSSATAERDITREIWNRILVNMPFFLKAKGSVRALKGLVSVYGLPSTILRVREYGGPVLPDQNPQMERIRKFRRSLDFYGSQNVETTWADDTNSGRVPDTVEFRFRAVQSGSGEFKQVLYQKGTDWAITLKDDGSQDNYGYLTFAITGSSSNAEITSSLLPVFDNEFWSVMLTRKSASTEPLVDDGNSRNIDYELFLKKYDATRNRIHYQSSASLNVDGRGGGAPQGMNNRFQQDGRGYIGGDSSRTFGNQFTGSMMEFRYWNSALSQSNFDNHVRAPKAYDGNHPSASWTDLVLRYSFNKEVNHGTGSVDILDTSADQSYYQTGSAKNYPDRSNYSYTEDINELFVPNTGPHIRRATKVRVEENRLIHGSKLSVDSRNEVSAYDLTSTDSNKLGVYFAPSDVINEDIMFSMGNLDFSDYIGDPRDQFKTYYRGLRKIKDIYWQKYNSPNNFWDYIRILKFYDKAIFEQMKSLIPARANAHLGTLIEPNLFERSKAIIGKPPERENTYWEDSIDLNYAESASGQYLDTEGFISESTHPGLSGTEDYFQTFISESTTPGLDGTSDYYQTFISESAIPGLNGTQDYYQSFISESVVPNLFGLYVDTEGFVSESVYPGLKGEYGDYTSSIDINTDVLTFSGTYEDFSKVATYGPNSSTGIDTYETFHMPSLYSFTNNARGDNTYSGSYIAGHNGGYSGGQNGKSIFEEVEPPFISGSRKSEYHMVETYFYNSKNSFYRGGNMNIKDHARFHSNSSSLKPAEITPLYESSTGLRNLFFDGCKLTDDGTTDGKEVIEVTITSPTILTTKESGDSKLSVE